MPNLTTVLGKYRSGKTPVLTDGQELELPLANDGSLRTSFSTDAAIGDAFGRLRISNPETIFDSKNCYNDPDLPSNVENLPLFYDNTQIAGTGTYTTYDDNQSSQTIAVSGLVVGMRVRQTKMRFNYQPGKSQLIMLTFNMNGAVPGIVKREGLFDEKNGIFIELAGTDVNLVRRTYTSGAKVDNPVAQAQWNIDKMDGTGRSGIRLDFTKAQIFVIDFEWLGVGRVRCGWNIDGVTYYCHQFTHSNVVSTVYMSTPNLPVRTEIANAGTGAQASITQICVSVMSEGGFEDNGVLRYASTGGSEVGCTSENTLYAILGIQLRPEYIGATIKILNIALQEQTGSKQLEWVLLLNPTVAGSFTYTAQSQSAVKIAKGATANTVTGGYQIAGGFFNSAGNQGGSSGSSDKGLLNALLLGALVDGTVDSIVLCVRPVGGSTNANVEGSLTWREIQ